MKKNFRVALAQLNFLVGNIEGNTNKIIENILVARDKLKSNLIIFPELAITGYPPEDLLLRHGLYDRVELALEKIKNNSKNIHIIVGYPKKQDKQRFNQAAHIYNGKIITTYNKQRLPNYSVFDEMRYFTAGAAPCVTEINGIKVAITICEDLWHAEAMAQAVMVGANMMVSINSSPFDINKPYLREQILSHRAKEGSMPIVYVNCIGGQDELIFDGGSMVINANGSINQHVEFYKEALYPVTFEMPTLQPIMSKALAMPNEEERVYEALVLGVRDYIEKNHFKGAVVALSGGVDSALTLAIAVDAIGKDGVEAVTMPSRYTSNMSVEDASKEAKTLGVNLANISIEPIFKACLKSLEQEFQGLAVDATEENLQARARAIVLMAISNKKGLIVLSTGNKSEMAVGYATLYGDMVGGFCVLKDVHKTLVYRLAKYRNNISAVIPERVLTRAPSAELAANQKDQDALPPYPILDEILQRYIEKKQSRSQIINAGFDEAIVCKIINMVNNNEYKRRQAPPGVKITKCAFGRDRRYPITSGYDKNYPH